MPPGKTIISVVSVLIVSVSLPLSAARAAASDAAILNNQGVEFYDRGNYAAAEEKFRAAILLDEGNVNLYVNRGYAQQAMGDHKAAVASFKKGVIVDPGNLEAHNSLGVSFYNIGEIERAVAEWEFVLTAAPGNVAAAANLGMARHPERADEIIAETKFAPGLTSAAAAPSTLEGKFSAGKQAYMDGDYKTAADFLKDIIGVKPDSKFSYYYLGLSLAYLGEIKDAMRNLREYLILESYPPESPQSYGHAESAFKSLRAGKKLPPRPMRKDLQAEKAYDAGRTAFKAGDYFKAIPMFRTAFDLKPDSYPVNYYLGLSYKAVGERERGAFHLAKCLMADLGQGRKEEANEVARLLKELTK